MLDSAIEQMECEQEKGDPQIKEVEESEDPKKHLLSATDIQLVIRKDTVSIQGIQE